MFFGQDIGDLQDDGFEGSVDERLIFSEVFFGNGSGTTSKRCLVTGVINFESNCSKQINVPVLGNSGISVLSSQGNYNVKDNSKDHTGSGHFSEGCASSLRSNDGANTKRLKLSVDEFSPVEPSLGKMMNSSAPSEGVFPGSYQSALHPVYHNVTCRLVESSNQCVTSRSYLLRQRFEKDRADDVINRDIPKCKSSSLDGNEGKECISAKPIASPVSQESHVTKLVVANSSFISENLSGCNSKSRWKETSFVKIDIDEKPLTADVMNDPRSLLRYYTNHLLRSAGWEIGKRRKRSNKIHKLGEFVFRSPQGRPFRDFQKVWDLCGQTLFHDANSLVEVSDGKRWTDMTHFCSDLSNTFLEIQELLKRSETTTSLAHRWCLLDPYANVVFIDKTLAALKAGKEVKTMKRFAIDSSAKYDSVLASTNVDLSSLPACGSDITCNQSDSSLFEVPVGSGNAVNGGSQLVSTHQDSSKSNANCEGDKSELIEERNLNVLKDVSVVTFEKEVEGTDKVESLLQQPMADHSNSIHDDLTESHGSDETDVQFHTCARSMQLEVLKDVSVVTFEKEVEGTDKVEILLQQPVADHSNSICDDLTESHRSDGTDVQFHTSATSMQLPKPALVDPEGMQCTGGLPCEVNDENFAADIISKEKAQKKSEDLKEIKLTTLYENERIGSTDELVEVAYDSNHMEELHFENVTVEAPLLIKNDCLDSQAWSPGNISKTLRTQDESKQKESIIQQIKDDDLLISALIKSKSFRSSIKRSNPKRRSCKSKRHRKRKSQKGSCRLLPRNLNKGGKMFMEGKWSAFASRTILSWLIHSGVVSLKEVIQYWNPKDDAVVKDGLVTWDGILCRCCGEVLSVSEFKIHSGYRLNKPCMNLLMESGKPFTLCQLEAWSEEYKVRRSATRTVQVDEMDENDDICGLCGDGGELLCCDNCPSTFHQACLCEQDIPEGSWYCSYCTCRICGNAVHDKEASKSEEALKCSQCEHKYHFACLRGRGANGQVDSDTWFCGQDCQEVYSGLQSRIGFMNVISDGFSWMLLRCIHGDQKVHSEQRFVALKAECNSKLAVSLTIMEECFLSMVDPRTGIDMIPHVVYNWGSCFPRVNYHGFYTVVLEKDDVLISVASIRIHGVTVAEMPLVATCSKYRRQGMFRRLMSSIEEMLRALKVQKLVISAIPSLVETWTVGFGFLPLDDSERQSLNNVNLMVFPGTVLLKKPIFENQAMVEPSDSNNSSASSGADDGTEAKTCSQLGPNVDLDGQPSEGSCAKPKTDTETTKNEHDECQTTFEEREEGGDLHIKLSKLSCQNGIVSHVESSMEMYDERRMSSAQEEGKN